MVYTALVGSKHKSESLLQNLATDITKVQTMGGIVLLGGDFNAPTAVLLDTVDTNDLCDHYGSEMESVPLVLVCYGLLNIVAGPSSLSRFLLIFIYQLVLGTF